MDTSEFLYFLKPTTLAVLLSDLTEVPARSSELERFMQAIRRTGESVVGIPEFETLYQFARSDDLVYLPEGCQCECGGIKEEWQRHCADCNAQGDLVAMKKDKE